MADDTQDVDWNELRPGDVQVAPGGRERTVTNVAEVPTGFNWVKFDGGVPVSDGGRVTIRARSS